MTQPSHPLVWLNGLGIPPVDRSSFGENRAAVEGALAAQCGEVWRGFVQAPLHAQVFLTICHLQIEDGTSSLKAGDMTLAEVAASIEERFVPFGVPPGPRLAPHVQIEDSTSNLRANEMKLAAAAAYIEDGFRSGAAVSSLMAPYIADERLVAEIDERSKYNGFVNTVLLSNLFCARREGDILAAAEILWLREVDRHAWHAVDSLGRKAHFIEAAGSMAHWLTERKSFAPISTPEVLPALDALDRYIAEHSTSHQQGPNHAH